LAGFQVILIGRFWVIAEGKIVATGLGAGILPAKLMASQEENLADRVGLGSDQAQKSQQQRENRSVPL